MSFEALPDLLASFIHTGTPGQGAQWPRVKGAPTIRVRSAPGSVGMGVLQRLLFPLSRGRPQNTPWPGLDSHARASALWVSLPEGSRKDGGSSLGSPGPVLCTQLLRWPGSEQRTCLELPQCQQHALGVSKFLACHPALPGVGVWNGRVCPPLSHPVGTCTPLTAVPILDGGRHLLHCVCTESTNK